MNSSERLEFAPPPTPGLLRSLALAILAHAVLVAVLTAGVAWKREVVTTTVEAELWSALPQEAAPPAPEPVPEPTPAEPPVPPQPTPEVKPEPPPQAKADADIALAREKARKDKEKQLAQEKLEREKKARELEKQKLARLEQEKKDKAQKDKALKEKAQKEAAQAKREAQKLEEARKQQLERMAKLAGGGSGSPSSTGSAAQASGPSAGYMGRIVGRIKPNIVFSDTISGNPRAEVEIRVSPTGTILSAKVSQSSGVKAWDEAVVRAIEKTEVLPKDVDGSIPTSMTIGFRPKD